MVKLLSTAGCAPAWYGSTQITRFASAVISKDLGQLGRHDPAPADRPMQRGLVEDHLEPGWVLPGEDALPGQPRLDTQLNLLRVEQGHATLVAGPGVGDGLQRAVDHR